MTRPAAVTLALALAACGGASEKDPVNPEPEREEPEEDATEAEQIAAIATAVNELSPAVHSCWARGAADDFKLEGRTVVQLTVGRDGASEDVEVMEDSTGDRVLTACLVALWSDWRWPDIFAEGDAIMLPPFAFVAPDGQFVVAEGHVAEHSLAQGKLGARVILDAKATGNAAAALTILTLEDGLEVPLHKHDAAEVLYLLSGAGELTDARGKTAVAAGAAIYVPTGAAHGFVHIGEDPAVLVQVYAPGGAEQRFENPEVTAGTSTVTAKEARKLRRAARPKVAKTADAEALSIAGGRAEVRILFDEKSAGDKAAYIGALTARPDASVPLHRHSESTELLYILEGEALMTISGREIPIHPGDAIQIPPGTEHGVQIGGDTALKALQFYTPSGPEQRFRGTP